MNKMLLRKTIRDLAASRSQTIALIVVVALGISSFIALIAAYRDLDTSYNHTYAQLAFADVTFQVEAAPASALAEIEEVAGVTAVTGRLIIDTGFELPDGEPIRSRLIGLPAGEQPAVNKLYIEDGRYLPPDAAQTALLEATFAGIYDITPGETVTPIVNGETVPFDVSGIVASPEYLIVSPSQQNIFPSPRTFAVLFVPLGQLQTMTDRQDTINDVAVRIAPDADQERVISEIQAKLEPYQLAATTPRADNPSHAALQLDLEGYREIANLMPSLILIVAAISVYMMLGRLVRAQQSQIGLMKALGTSNRAVMGHYLTFAAVIGGLGLVLGIAGGVPLARAIVNSYAAELGIPLIETRFYPDLVGLAVLLSVVLFALAGLGPARSSARLEPAIAMRPDPATAPVQGRVSLLERLVQLPLWLRLPWRNVFRMRRRSLTTGLGIIFAFVLVLMVWGILDSMNYLIGQQFDVIERWQVTAVFDTPQSPEIVDRVAGWEGVEEVEPIIQLPVTLKRNGREEDVLLTALDPEQQMHVLQLGPDMTPAEALADGRIVLTEAIADQLTLNLGDTLTVDTPFGEETFTLGGEVDELMSAAAYLSLDEAQAMNPLPPPIYNGLYLQVEAAQAEAIKTELYHLPGAASVQLKAELRRDIEELLGLFYVFMGVMLLFALAMAFALIFNAMTVNVLERERELATMRAIGTGARQIAREITLENSVLWLLALVPGLWLGWWTAVQMGEAFSAELFTFEVVIHPASYVLTAAGILLTMLLAAWPAIRRVNRLNLAEATKVLT